MSEREQMISALRSRHAFFMNGATWMEAVDPDELCQDAATEIERLVAERDLWRARAMAMFWKLPDHITVGELQRDSDRALAFVPKD